MPYTPSELLAELGRLAISYEHFEHPACFTVQESQLHCSHIPGVHVKNLFLKDQKTDALFLVTVPDERVIDLKTLPEKVGARKFSFGKPDLLLEVLGVLPGSVTPFGLINDAQKRVQPVLDRWMMEQPIMNCHPLVNTATIALKPEGLMRFMKSRNYQPILLDLAA